MLSKIKVLVLIAMAVGVGVFFANESDILKLVSPINETRISAGEGIIPAMTQPEIITDLQVLNLINSKREQKSLNKLSINTELNKAALIRLAVINEYQDWEGSVSGMNREKSILSTTYSPSTVGDIFAGSISKLDELTTAIDSDPIDSDTLYLKDFTDIGIAVKKLDKQSSVYLVFANQAKKVATPIKPTSSTVNTQNVNWGGPEVWSAVNKRRVEFGVGQLTRKDELCTIASIRLNQLLELKKLDGHAGFQPVLDRADLKWISEKYSISEYLAQGYESPEATVKGWENTLGHRSLLTGGEFVWGCIYSQNTFSVAITAY